MRGGAPQFPPHSLARDNRTKQCSQSFSIARMKEQAVFAVCDQLGVSTRA